MQESFPLRLVAGAVAVAAGAFVVFQFAVERGAQVDEVTWTAIAWASILVMLGGTAVAAIAAWNYVWGEIQGRRTRVEMTTEGGPTTAEVLVRNRGRSDTMIATVTVLEVLQGPLNPPGPGSYNLMWVGAGAQRTELLRESVDTLLLARARHVTELDSPTRQYLYEISLIGWEGQSHASKDSFRWSYGEENAVVIRVAVEVFAQKSRRSARRAFEILSHRNGAISVRPFPQS